MENRLIEAISIAELVTVANVAVWFILVVPRYGAGMKLNMSLSAVPRTTNYYC